MCRRYCGSGQTLGAQRHRTALAFIAMTRGHDSKPDTDPSIVFIFTHLINNDGNLGLRLFSHRYGKPVTRIGIRRFAGWRCQSVFVMAIFFRVRSRSGSGHVDCCIAGFHHQCQQRYWSDRVPEVLPPAGEFYPEWSAPHPWHGIRAELDSLSADAAHPLPAVWAVLIAGASFCIAGAGHEARRYELVTCRNSGVIVRGPVMSLRLCQQRSPRRWRINAAVSGINAAKNCQNDNGAIYRLFDGHGCTAARKTDAGVLSVNIRAPGAPPAQRWRRGCLTTACSAVQVSRYA